MLKIAERSNVCNAVARQTQCATAHDRRARGKRRCEVVAEERHQNCRPPRLPLANNALRPAQSRLLETIHTANRQSLEVTHAGNRRIALKYVKKSARTLHNNAP